MSKTLIVITGPTGSGKTAVSIKLARRLGCEIISADSRQLFGDVPVGTAAPTPDELAAAPHHFVGTLGLDDYYSAAQFEADVMELLPRLFEKSDYAILCGGSMMYVDAVVYGIDELPTISDDVRHRAYAILESEGIAGALKLLERLDPEYYAIVDKANHKRVVHAIEICMEAGRPYSSLRTGKRKSRDFKVRKFAFDYSRDELFDRINRRVEAMITNGLVAEAQGVIDRRGLNSLNTVGYKEMFRMLDGEWDLSTAVARMQKNTRVFAKKQLTWLKKQSDIEWIDPRLPDVADEILKRLAT